MRLAPGIAALALLAAAAPVRAQTATQEPSIIVSQGFPSDVNQADCQANRLLQVTYSFPNGVPATAKLAVYVAEATQCTDDPPTDSKVLMTRDTITQSNQTQALSFNAQDVKALAGCPAAVEKSLLVCAVATIQQSNGTILEDKVYSKKSVEITYDSQPPSAPQLTEAVGGDSAIHLRWSGSDAANWRVTCTPIGPAPAANTELCAVTELPSDAGAPGPADAAQPPTGVDAGPPDAAEELDAGAAPPEKSDTFPGSVTSGSLEGLTNDQEYECRVTATDDAGNASPPSEAFRATPRAVQDFYRRYRCLGGTEEGGFGCSSAGAGAIPLAALAGAALLGLAVRGLRRRP